MSPAGRSRREALLLAAGLAVTRTATAQTSPDRLVLRNRTGIKVSPFGDANRPSLAVTLPQAPEVNAAVIELPEHAWLRSQPGGEPEWFYRMYTREARFMGQATWTREADALRYSMKLPSGFTLAATAKLEPDGLAIEYQIVNPRDTAFTEVQAPTCIKLYRPFTDVFLERTYVHHAEGLDLVASETPERLGLNAEEWFPCRYIVRCSPSTVVPKDRIEKQADGITRYHKLRIADSPFIATASSPAGWVAATHAVDTDSVWTNPARTCHHADSSARLAGNSTAHLGLKLYLIRGGMEDAWRLVAAAQQRRQP